MRVAEAVVGWLVFSSFFCFLFPSWGPFCISLIYWRFTAGSFRWFNKILLLTIKKKFCDVKVVFSVGLIAIVQLGSTFVFLL